MDNWRNSATLATDCRRWLANMQEIGEDYWLTETGDLVTKFECERLLGLNDELDQDK